MNFINKISITALALFNLSISFAGPIEFYMQQYQEKLHPLVIPKSIDELHFTQLIDHNNPESGTFSQRYYIDESYGPNADAPVFFYICGEAACTKRSLSGAIRTHAKKHHAKLVALEHRYYGQSLPFNSFSTQALQYLSTEAALDDLAYFQRRIRDQKNWSGTWIAFGGSYPGSLSAYYRMKFPYLIAGSLASSAPVMAKEDFIEYDRHVTEVAGPRCAAQMRQVVSEAEAALNNAEKLNAIKALFKASDINDPVDFLYLIADTGSAAVQYGMKDSFCKHLSSSTSPLEGHAEFARKLYTAMGIDAVDLTAQGSLSENPADYKNGAMRQWYYQSCTEYGYWQNANPDSEKSTRSALINLDYHRQICQRLFGLKEPARTTSFNATYYSPLMDELVTNIYFTNGSNDPWSTLSMVEKNGNTTNAKLSYYLIQGAAHCDDLRTPSPTDSASLIKSREIMDSLLEQWLN